MRTKWGKIRKEMKEWKRINKRKEKEKKKKS